MLPGMRRPGKPKDKTDQDLWIAPEEIEEARGSVDLNEVVAYNFRRARELRGLTQEETADTLARFLGTRLPQAGISAIERSFDGDRRREFDAQEIMAFACAFDLPMLWFFLPPPGDHRPLRRTSDRVNELYELVLGRPDQLDVLYERFRELGIPEPDEVDVRLAAMTGRPTERQVNDYRARRKELLLALVDEWADDLDKVAGEMGRFFDHLRAVGLRGLVGENTGDREFLYSAAQRHELRTELDTMAGAEEKVDEAIAERWRQVRPATEGPGTQDDEPGSE